MGHERKSASDTAVRLCEERDRTEDRREHGRVRHRMCLMHGAARGCRRRRVRAVLRNRERLERGEVLRAIGDRVRGEDHALAAVCQLPAVRPDRVGLWDVSMDISLSM